jgi:agmatine/peptidylarginine deiminase
MSTDKVDDKLGETVPDDGDSGVIVPDYEPPQALMVPHYPDHPNAQVNAIAVAAAFHVGVILLSARPAASQAWAERQPDPARYRVVGAVFDTPWIRDRSPIAVRRKVGIDWVLPRMDLNRALDDALFASLSARPVRESPLVIEQGNLVAGPDGLVLSTHRVLRANELRTLAPLEAATRPLGIRRWVLFPAFVDELSGHADAHVRFLAPDLAAVAWNEANDSDKQTAVAIETQVRGALPDAEILRIPIRREGRHCASLVNWIQLRRTLLVPRFPITPEPDLRALQSLVATHGFECRVVDSPTHHLGGSLHCLTASIYV